jgi:hypothetical protein
MAKNQPGESPGADASAPKPPEQNAPPATPGEAPGVGPSPSAAEEPKGPPTLHDHAVATGNVAASAPAFTFGSSRQRYSWQHEAAAQLHGWNAHSQHSADPLSISLDDYKAALKAAESDPLQAHLPAVSPAHLAHVKANQGDVRHLTEATK